MFAVSVYAGSRPKAVGTDKVEPKETEAAVKAAPANPVSKVKVTFIELGSVKCVPCKMMVPVMEEIEKKYGKDVKVVFHDVWTPAGEPYAKQYGIRGIPTQIFLDENGKEFHRHTGFYPLEQILPVLKQGGVKVD
ncbi:MAG: thioredoxin family protein [Candidatus Goldbacteria bacterium]|nr:thioredoxin family protein [Candidatus Goldiibacteriota bacterium]